MQTVSIGTMREVQGVHKRRLSKTGLFLVALVFLLTLRPSSAAEPSSATSPTAHRHQLEALRTQLLSNYSGHFAPVQKKGQVLPVFVTFTFLALVELNAAKQELTLQSSISLSWTDPDLSWNSTEEGSPGEDIAYLEIASDDIWIPKVMITNQKENDEPLQHVNLMVTQQGLCMAAKRLQTSTICQIDVTRYPFDTQQCQLTVTPFLINSVNLTGYVHNLRFSDVFNMQGEWDVEDIVAVRKVLIDPTADFSRVFIEFQLTLRRRYAFYVLTVLIPMMILSVTGACGFLLPAQCGERVSFQMSIMVSLSVFLSFINDTMPKTSSSTSRLAIYLDLLLLQSCLSLLATLTVLRGRYRHEKLGEQEKKEEKGTAVFATRIAPENQDVAREATPNTSQDNGGWREALRRPSRGPRRATWTWLRQVFRRWYCCCCCFSRLSPEQRDVFFLVLFLTATLTGPVVFFI